MSHELCVVTISSTEECEVYNGCFLINHKQLYGFNYYTDATGMKYASCFILSPTVSAIVHI